MVAIVWIGPGANSSGGSFTAGVWRGGEFGTACFGPARGFLAAPGARGPGVRFPGRGPKRIAGPKSRPGPDWGQIVSPPLGHPPGARPADTDRHERKPRQRPEGGSRT